MMETIFNALKIMGLVLMVLNLNVTISVVSSIGKAIGEKMGLEGKDTLFPAAASTLAFAAGFVALEPTIMSALAIPFWMAVWSVVTSLGIRFLEGWLRSHNLL